MLRYFPGHIAGVVVHNFRKYYFVQWLVML